jgi:hypothetical protein
MINFRITFVEISSFFALRRLLSHARVIFRKRCLEISMFSMLCTSMGESINHQWVEKGNLEVPRLSLSHYQPEDRQPLSGIRREIPMPANIGHNSSKNTEP